MSFVSLLPHLYYYILVGTTVVTTRPDSSGIKPFSFLLFRIVLRLGFAKVFNNINFHVVSSEFDELTPGFHFFFLLLQIFLAYSMCSDPIRTVSITFVYSAYIFNTDK